MHLLTWLIVQLAIALALTTGAEPPLAPGATIPLDGVNGRIDHFAIDAAGQRLFMAALGNDTVEVIDLIAGKAAHQIKGLRAPQGIAFAADLNRLAIANDKDGSLRLFDATTLKHLTSVDLSDDADNVRYDPKARAFWVGYGDGGLACIDAATGKRLTDIKLDAHPESFQLESNGPRIFVNVPHAAHVAVVDRNRNAVIAKWPLKDAQSNFPMALDENSHRLFIGCRQPAKLLVLDTANGNTIASVDIAGDTDDLWFDPVSKRILISGGDGRVTVVAQSSPDNYTVVANVPTAAGARTSFYVQQTQTLYVAVPHRGDQRCELRAFTLGIRP